MDNRLTLRPQLPQVRELDSPNARAAPQAAPGSTNVPLQTRVPNLGPYTMSGSGFYDLQLYPGPLLRMVSAPSTGQQLDTSA